MSDAKTANEKKKHDAREDLRDAAHKIGEGFQEAGGAARDYAKERAAEAGRRAQDAYEEGRERVRVAEDRFETYVREHPLKSVAIAAGVGLLLGLFSRR